MIVCRAAHFGQNVVIIYLYNINNSSSSNTNNNYKNNSIIKQKNTTVVRYYCEIKKRVYINYYNNNIKTK